MFLLLPHPSLPQILHTSSNTVNPGKAAVTHCLNSINEVSRVSGKVHLEGNKTAVSGASATLSCWYSVPSRVHQVLWRKTAEQGDTTTVAFYTKNGQKSVMEQFASRVGLSRSLGDTQLTIQSIKMEDEACYTCEFNAYPDGTKAATTCLSVYGEHHVLCFYGLPINNLID